MESLTEKYLLKTLAIKPEYKGNMAFDERNKKEFNFVNELIQKGLIFEILKGEKEYGLNYNFFPGYQKYDEPDQNYGEVYRILSFLINEQVLNIETITNSFLQFFDDPNWDNYVFEYLSLENALSKTYGSIFNLNQIANCINQHINAEIYSRHQNMTHIFNSKHPETKIDSF